MFLLLLLLQMDGERTWYVRGSRLWQRGRPSSWHVAPSLERLSAGDVVAVRRAADASMRLAVNGHDVALRVPALPADHARALTLAILVQQGATKAAHAQLHHQGPLCRPRAKIRWKGTLA